MYKYFIPIFILSFSLLSPNFGKAAGFELQSPNKNIIIEEVSLSSFKEEAKFSEKRLIEYYPVSPSRMLEDVLGEESKTKNDSQKFNFQISKIYSYVKKISESINQEPVEPDFKLEEGRVINFVLPEDGLKLYVYESSLDILKNLQAGHSTSSLQVYTEAPKKTLAETNSLGITELVSRGESDFSGSPANRRHNIKVGTKKMKGVILEPGEEFSFNKFLGPVIAKEGYLPELVIKRNGTISELGGGLCQISSTTFRAAIEAGIPITERKNHSYAVTYYAPQGTDATIYPGHVDLKFINDTGSHLLIWPYIQDYNKLIFDFYGTKDNRVVTIEDPVQYDKKPNGAMKATWTRNVFNNGTTTTDTFKSNYLPPELFHEEETFIE